MSSFDSPVVALRRRRLKQWVEDHHGGIQASFVAKIGINQGELSGLLNGRKSFGEKKARTIEQSAGMPDNYLDGEENKITEKQNSPISNIATDTSTVAWAVYQQATAATRAAVDLLLLPPQQRAAILSTAPPALAGGVDLIEQYAQVALGIRKRA